MTSEFHKQDLEKFLAKKPLDDRWKTWVRTNLDAGCDKNGMFRIMIDEGFSYDVAKDALDFAPAIPVDQIINPLKISESAISAEAGKEAPLAPFIPNARRLEDERIEFYVVDDFLNEKECIALCRLIEGELRPSTITAQDEPDKYFRSSRTCDLGLIQDDLVREMDRRICAMVGLSPQHSESLQGQHYEIGQEFKAHTDYFEEAEFVKFGGDGGQRSYTFMIYLNDVEDGGETSFPKIDQKISPKLGRAVIWNSLYPDGKVNDHSLHHALPVLKGHKTVITKWFRTQDGFPAFVRENNENFPNYTRTGFEKDRLPKPLFEKIEKFYRENLGKQVTETAAKGFIDNRSEDAVSSSLVELPQVLRDEIQICLKPILEIWSGVRLDPTFVYGIRIYHHGTALKVHRDRLETHIISAIINVDQDVNEPWALRIEDNAYRQHDVYLAPGEIIYYEGGRLAHGRPHRLNGKSFANIFCHFKPEVM